MDKEKEIKKLRTQKLKYKRQGNQRLVAEYANSIGNLCSELGQYRQAIDEHECELTICQDLKDIEGEAVACRKLGECYMELGELETANENVNRYVELARTLPSKVELQRAYITLGRLCLVEIPSLIPKTAKRIQCEKKAESTFMKALEWCDKLKASLTSLEYHEMRARTILNLGLLADLKGEEKEAIANFKNASVIARKSNLHATLIASLNNRADVLARLAQFTEARSVLEDALDYRKYVNLSDCVNSVRLYAQVTAEMGDVGVGLDTVKAILRSVKDSPEKEELRNIAIKLYKIILAKRKVPRSSNEERKKIFEKIGDYCCDLGAYHHALLSYQKTLDILNDLKESHNTLPPILVSMARTYQDLKNYDQAINYFCQEAKLQQQLRNFEQAAKSLLNVANCMEYGSCNTDMIQQCYKKAESHARSAEDPKLLLLVLKNCRDSLKSLDCWDGHEDCCRKIEQITTEYGVSADSQEDSQITEVDGDISSDGGFELSDHSSDEERETEVVSSTRCRPFKISRNEMGETKLHQAVIKGKKDVVLDLLNKGHPTDVRDHAGWLPIHEAAVHNHSEIAQLLVDRGTDINDRAGKEGITPLHDACSSGCTETLQLLIDSGASVIAKDNENLYPLDHLVQYLHRSHEELSGEELQDLLDLEGMIRTAMLSKGITPKNQPFREQLQEQRENGATQNPQLMSCLKESAENERDVSLETEELPTRVVHSPQVSAAEMYKSAVANVRKSAKRLALPQCISREGSDMDKVPALLPQDSDKNILSTGSWLVDDFISSPVKKRQKRNSCKRAVSLERGLDSSLSVIEDTPEKLSFHSPDPAHQLSPMADLENLPAYEHNGSAGKSNMKPSGRRLPLAALSPIMDLVSQSSQPLTPAFGESRKQLKKTAGGESECKSNQVTSALRQLEALFEVNASREDINEFDVAGEKGEVESAKAEPNTFEADSDTQVMARSPSPLDKMGEAKLSNNNIVETLLPVNRNVEMRLSGDKTAESRLSGDKTEKSRLSDNEALEARSSDNHTVEQRLSDEEQPRRHSGDEQAGSGGWHKLTSQRSSELTSIQKPHAINSKEGAALDGPFCCDTRPADGDHRIDRNNEQISSTSTPMRQRRSAGQSSCKVEAFTAPVISSEMEKRNEAVMTPILFNKPIDAALNSSVMTCSNSVAHTACGSLDTSYYQNTRVIVQWKNRSLLIPVPRNGSLSIKWLSEEFLRRVARRRSLQTVPKPSQIYLTRAIDGAELFSEDAIQDLLVDNEKVIVNEEEQES